jgi:hypothetical protein
MKAHLPRAARNLRGQAVLSERAAWTEQRAMRTPRGGPSARRCGALASAVFVFAGWTFWSTPTQAVVVSGSNGNVTADSLAAAGGPAAGQAGFANVGTSSTNNASVVYLGNGWAMSAGHVTISSGVGPVRFAGVPFTVDDSSVTYLHNADNSLADLKLFRINGDPGLPSITPALIKASPPSGRQIMIGNGLRLSENPSGGIDPLFWSVDKSTSPWQWTPGAAPAAVGPNDYSGYGVDATASHVIRWGENQVLETNLVAATGLDANNNPLIVHGYSTAWDNLDYTGVNLLASEAQATSGDSGGAVYQFVDGVWKLSGVMIAVTGTLSGQPADTVLFGDQTLIADLSYYRDQIVAIVPEPSGIVIAAMGLAAWAACRARRIRAFR